jgi:hypothetical protein
VNRHPTADWTLDLRVDDVEVANVEVHEMWSDDLSAKVIYPFLRQDIAECHRTPLMILSE